MESKLKETDLLIFTNISDKIPEIGKNVIGVDNEGNIHHCFLSKNIEWRCSLTGFGLLVDIKKWVYDEEYRFDD